MFICLSKFYVEIPPTKEIILEGESFGEVIRLLEWITQGWV
jgi:hypothetical protein